MSDSDTDKDIKPRPPRSRPPGRKPAKPISRGRAKIQEKSRKRRYSDSSDDSSDSDAAIRR